MVSGEDRHGRRRSTPCPNATASLADLGTKWEQDWQYQPNAATMYVRQGSIVTALKSKPLSITATCFQYHEYGRRTGLKIRSPQEGVGSSPTFGTKTTSPPNPRKTPGAGRTAAQGGVPADGSSGAAQFIDRLPTMMRGYLRRFGSCLSNRRANSPAVEGPRGGVG